MIHPLLSDLIVFVVVLADVSFSSDSALSVHEARLWALPITWHCCLPWSLLRTGIFALVFNRVRKKFQLLCCFFFSSCLVCLLFLRWTASGSQVFTLDLSTCQITTLTGWKVDVLSVRPSCFRIFTLDRHSRTVFLETLNSPPPNAVSFNEIVCPL